MQQWPRIWLRVHLPTAGAPAWGLITETSPAASLTVLDARDTVTPSAGRRGDETRCHVSLATLQTGGGGDGRSDMRQ